MSGLCKSTNLYIYNVPRSCGLATASNNFQWEAQLEAYLRRTMTVVNDPNHADAFLLPVCITSFWSTLWHMPEASQRRIIQSYTHDLAQRMNDRGPFWRLRKRYTHIIPRMMCPKYNAYEHWAFFNTSGVWNGRHIIYACIETATNDKIDKTRAMHLPYFVPFVPTRPVTATLPLVKFHGSRCCGRDALLTRLQIPSDISIDMHFTPRAAFGDSYASSYFTLQLHGDTPERIGMYQSWASGIPVLWDKPVEPPLRTERWPDGMGWVVSTKSLDLFNRDVMGLMRNYSQSAERLQSVRAVYQWHTAEFDAAFSSMWKYLQDQQKYRKRPKRGNLRQRVFSKLFSWG